MAALRRFRPPRWTVQPWVSIPATCDLDQQDENVRTVVATMKRDFSKLVLTLSLASFALSCATPAQNQPLRVTERDDREVSVESDQQVWVDPSGVRVVYERRDSSPVVALQLWVGVGSADERPHEAGLAHVHEHMIFKGTPSRGVGEIARSVEAVGGNINAWTSFDETVYHLTLPSRHFADGADILFDALCNSSFEADELARELEVIQEEIRRGEDMPSRVLSQAVFSAVFREHPYGLPIIGTSDSVASFSREDVLAFFNRWYAPNNMTFVVVGDVERSQIEAALEASLRCNDRQAVERPARPQEPEQQDGLRLVTLERDIQDVHLTFAWRGPELSHEDNIALDVLLTLLGGSESSILFDRIQRQRGLTRGVYAYLYSPMEPGLAMIGARARIPNEESERLQVLVDALVEQLAHVRHAPVSHAALERTKRLFEADIIHDSESVQSRAHRIGSFAMVAGDPAYDERSLEILQALTVQDLQRVAQRWLNPEQLTLGVLAPEGFDFSWLDKQEVQDRIISRDAEVAQRLSEAAGLEQIGDRVFRATLQNGLRVYIEQDSSVPLVTARLLMPGGLSTEPAGQEGVSRLLSEMFTSGTSARSAQQLAATLDGMGGSLKGISGAHAIGLELNVLSRDVVPGFELLAEALFQSSFPQEEFDRLQRETLDHFVALADQPAREAMRMLMEGLYGSHPYAVDLLGKSASVERLTRADILAYYDHIVRPQGAALSVVGDFSVEGLLELAEENFSSWQPSSLTWHEPAAPEPIAEPLSRESLRDRQQAHVALGWQAPGRATSQEAALMIMGAVLSGQGGRLFLELRDRQSLAYTVSAFWSPAIGSGAFIFYIGTAPDKVDTALAGLRAEVERLQTEPVTEAEIERARTYLIGSREVGLQRQAVRAAYRAFDVIFGPTWDYGDGFAERLMSVTAADIQEAARAIFRPEGEVLAIVRPERGELPAQDEELE